MVTGGIGDHKKMKKRFTRSKVNGGKWEEQNISHVHIFFFFTLFIVVQVQLSPFSPHPAIPTSHPWSYPLWLCPCILYTCSWKPFSLLPFPPIISSSPFWLLSVLNFNVFGYILLAYLFYWLSSTYRWNHIVFVTCSYFPQ